MCTQDRFVRWSTALCGNADRLWCDPGSRKERAKGRPAKNARLRYVGEERAHFAGEGAERQRRTLSRCWLQGSACATPWHCSERTGDGVRGISLLAAVSHFQHVWGDWRGAISALQPCCNVVQQPPISLSHKLQWASPVSREIIQSIPTWGLLQGNGWPGI